MSSSQIQRIAILPSVQNRVWARSAGRCVLCATYLIDTRSYFHSRSVAELAHNIGATDGAKSPRAKSSLSLRERSAEENILLLCHECHRRIDDPEMVGFFTAAYLRDAKMTHERRVREVTDFATLRPAAVLKVTAKIRGTLAPASGRQIAEALHPLHLTGFGEATRTGMYEVMLDDPEDADWSWTRGIQRIDQAVDSLQAAIEASDVEVAAVFALAPIPLLVHLGSRLDDKSETVLFRRARSDDARAWAWATDEAHSPAYDVSTTNNDSATQPFDEILLTVNVTADVKLDEIPPQVRGLPRVALSLATETPGPSVIDTRAALDRFSDGWQRALSLVEKEFPTASRVHVVAAVPAPAAIQMGRLHMRDAQPELAIYQRTSALGYVKALTVH